MKKPTAKRPAHRPTSLTPEVQASICDHIAGAEALSLAEAAKRSGVDPTTAYRWCERGERGEEPFRQFRQAVEEAKRRRVLALKDMWIREGRKDFKGIDRILQVIEPAEHALKVRVTIDQELEHVLDALEREFSHEPTILRRALAAIANRGSGRASPAGDGGEGAGGSGSGGDGGGEAVHPPPAE